MKLNDNAGGPIGILGIIHAKYDDPNSIFSLFPSTPQEWLIFVSTCLVICQLIHWGWRFKNYLVRWYKTND